MRGWVKSFENDESRGPTVRHERVMCRPRASVAVLKSSEHLTTMKRLFPVAENLKKPKWTWWLGECCAWHAFTASECGCRQKICEECEARKKITMVRSLGLKDEVQQYVLDVIRKDIGYVALVDDDVEDELEHEIDSFDSLKLELRAMDHAMKWTCLEWNKKQELKCIHEHRCMKCDRRRKVDIISNDIQIEPHIRDWVCDMILSAELFGGDIDCEFCPERNLAEAMPKRCVELNDEGQPCNSVRRCEACWNILQVKRCLNDLEDMSRTKSRQRNDENTRRLKEIEKEDKKKMKRGTFSDIQFHKVARLFSYLEVSNGCEVEGYDFEAEFTQFELAELTSIWKFERTKLEIAQDARMREIASGRECAPLHDVDSMSFDEIEKLWGKSFSPDARLRDFCRDLEELKSTMPECQGEQELTPVSSSSDSNSSADPEVTPTMDGGAAKRAASAALDPQVDQAELTKQQVMDDASAAKDLQRETDKESAMKLAMSEKELDDETQQKAKKLIQERDRLTAELNNLATPKQLGAAGLATWSSWTGTS